MEYIQTILFQITPENLERANQEGGLIPELDEHREYLRGIVGFRDMRVTRSINPEGNVLMVIETRWDNDAALVRYETSEPNVASIVRKHERLLAPDSLQVLDMEALRTESSWAAAEHGRSAMERVTLPILIPVGVLAFIVLVVYGLSRVYLEIGGDTAVGLAAGISIGVLVFAFYFANNPKAPGWQIGGVLAVCAAVLIGGAIWAVAEEDEAEGDHEPNGANGEPTPPPDGNGGDLIIFGDNYFDFGGERNPAIPVPAGAEAVFMIENHGAVIHNLHVDGTNNSFTENPCAVGGDNNGCSDPNIVPGGTNATLTVQIDEPGSYNFRCDFHPVEMTGTLVVE
jgi:heme-degrading monooxygenase HmoA